MGHADGQFSEIGQGRETLIQTFLEGFDSCEIRLDNSLIGSVGRHTHETMNADMLIRASGGIFINYGFYLLFIQAAFGQFCAQVQFQQDINDSGIG